MNMSNPDRSLTNRYRASCSKNSPPQTPMVWITILVVFLCLLFPLTGGAKALGIKDSRGRHIVITTPFKRIISLYGAHTENLFSLGLGHEVIGVSINDHYPPEVENKPRFSYHDDPEKFLAASPDLVLVRPMIDLGYPDFIAQLENFGITVVSLQPASVDEMFNYWKKLGRLTGREHRANAMVTDFKSKVRDIQEKISGIHPKKRVYFESIHSRMKTFSKGSMPLFALDMAGGINVADDAKRSRGSNIANYGKERLLSKGHQIDIFLAQRGIMNPVNKDQILSEPGFQSIKAIQTGQVYLIDEAIVSRPVARLYNGITTIGKILYPTVFTP